MLTDFIEVGWSDTGFKYTYFNETRAAWRTIMPTLSTLLMCITLAKTTISLYKTTCFIAAAAPYLCQDICDAT